MKENRRDLNLKEKEIGRKETVTSNMKEKEIERKETVSLNKRKKKGEGTETIYIINRKLFIIKYNKFYNLWIKIALI